MGSGRHLPSAGKSTADRRDTVFKLALRMLQEAVPAGAWDLWLWGDWKLPVCRDPAAPERYPGAHFHGADLGVRAWALHHCQGGSFQVSCSHLALCV